MTSGPPNIPIRTFEDVIYHGYKVITNSPYYENILANSKLGSAKLEVYNNHFEMKKDWEESMKALIGDSDSKTLMYAVKTRLITKLGVEMPSGGTLAQEAYALNMVDSVHGISTLALQKDSEFLPLFNHYILKALEGGIYKKPYRDLDLYTHKTFGMMEAQPLGFNNVVFCFISIGFGICLSIITVMIEFIKKKLQKQMPGKVDEGTKRSGIGTIREEREQEGSGNRQKTRERVTYIE